MKINQGQEIIEIPVNAKEEKLFHWIESDEYLGSWMPGEKASVGEKTKSHYSLSNKK